MLRLFLSLIAPTLSMGLLTLGNGLFITLTTLQLKSMNASTLLIGIVVASYFAGQVIGSYFATKFIIRVGYIRAFALFAACIAVCTIAQGTSSMVFWIPCRFIIGYGIAGLFIVVESWFLSQSTNKTRGIIFGSYLFTYYLALAGGQLLLLINYSSPLVAFCLISALASLSIVPVCFTRFSEPKIETESLLSPITLFKQAHVGIIGTLVAGLIIGVILGLYPLLLKHAGQTKSQMATILFLIISCGAILQVPIGKLSDIFERRLILSIVCAGAVFVSCIMMFFHANFWELAILSSILGSLVYVIYPLSISHTTDRIDEKDVLAALSLLTLVYGVGCTLGPLAASGLMTYLGDPSIFIFFIVFCGALGIYAYLQTRIKKPVKEEDKTKFVASKAETPSIVGRKEEEEPIED